MSARLWSRSFRRRISRGWLQSLLCALTIALGVSLFLAVVYAGEASISSFGRSLRSFGVSDDLIVIRPEQRPVRVESVFPILQQLPADIDITAVFEAVAVLAGSQRETFAVIGIEGRASGLEVSSRLAERLELKNGAAMELVLDDRSLSLPVTVVEEESFGYPSDTIVGSYYELRSLAGRQGGPDAIVLKARAGRSLATLRSTLADALRRLDSPTARLRIQDAGEIERDARRVLGAFRTNIVMLLFLTLLVCAFVILNVSQIASAALVRECSVLRTLGAPRRTIFGMLLIESAIVGGIGSLMGLTIGAPVTDAAAAAMLDAVSSIYTGAVRFEALRLGDFSALYLGTWCAGILTALIGSALPMWRVSGVPPGLTDRAPLAAPPFRPRRFHRTAAFGVVAACCAAGLARGTGESLWAYLAALAVVIILAGAAPLAVQHAAKFCARIGRSPHRIGFLLAAASVRGGHSVWGLASFVFGLSLAVLIGMSILITSFRATLTEWVEYTFQADLFIRPAFGGDLYHPSRLSPELLAEIEATPGVAGIYRVSNREISVQGERATLLAVDVLLACKSSTLRLVSGALDCESVHRGEGVFVSESLSRHLGVTVGDMIDHETVHLPIKAIYRDFSRDRGVIMIGRAAAQQQLGFLDVHSASVYLNPETAVETEARLRSALSKFEVRVLDNSEIKRLVYSIFENTFRITVFMRSVLVILCVLAFVFTALIQVKERAQELTLFQVLGVPQRTMRKLFLVEGGIAAAAGGVTGVCGGIVLGWMLVILINPLAFGWTLALRLTPGDIGVPIIWMGVGQLLAGIIPGMVVSLERSRVPLSVE